MRTAKMFWQDMCLRTFPAWCPISDHTSCCRADDCRFCGICCKHIRSGDDRRKRNSGGLLSGVMQECIYKFSPDSTFVILISSVYTSHWTGISDCILSM